MLKCKKSNAILEIVTFRKETIPIFTSRLQIRRCILLFLCILISAYPAFAALDLPKLNTTNDNDELAQKFKQLRESGIIRDKDSPFDEKLFFFSAQPFRPSDGEVMNLVALFKNNGRPVYGTVRIELLDSDGNVVKTIKELELGAHAASEEDINYEMDRSPMIYGTDGLHLWRYECAVPNQSAIVQARLRWVRDRFADDSIASKVDPLRDKELMQIDGSYLHDSNVHLTVKPFEQWKDWQKEFTVIGTHWVTLLLQ